MFFKFNMIIHYGLNFLMMRLIIYVFIIKNSQRTIEKVKEVTIIPASDILYDEQEVPAVLSKINDLRDRQIVRT